MRKYVPPVRLCTLPLQAITTLGGRPHKDLDVGLYLDAETASVELHVETGCGRGQWRLDSLSGIERMGIDLGAGWVVENMAALVEAAEVALRTPYGRHHTGGQ